MIFEELDLWLDPVSRNGPEAMAVDEWLLISRQKPLLRVYEWEERWGSLGYFSKLAEAKLEFPGVKFVRRWTGGGVVDHRNDWTYSLIIPQSCSLATMKGGQSYRLIHEVLADVLRNEGIAEHLAENESGAGGACFQHPVKFDVIAAEGRKVAGAAQRRTKHGLLHQGSVSAASGDGERAVTLARAFVGEPSLVELQPDPVFLQKLIIEKYGDPGWLDRR